DGLAGVVLQVDLLAFFHEGLAGEVGDFFALLRWVADGGLPAWGDELEGATDRDGIVAGRAIPAGSKPADGDGGGEQRGQRGAAARAEVGTGAPQMGALSRHGLGLPFCCY